MITIRAGNDYTGTRVIVLTFTDPDTDLPVDLTGGSAWAVVKRRRSDTDAAAAIFTATGGSGITSGTTLTIAADQTALGRRGQVDWAVAGTATAGLSGSYRFAAQARDSGGRVFEVDDQAFVVDAQLISASAV